MSGSRMNLLVMKQTQKHSTSEVLTDIPCLRKERKILLIWNNILIHKYVKVELRTKRAICC